MPAIPVPAPALADDVVALRPWRMGDVAAVTAACQDPEIPRWTTVPDPYSEDDGRVFIAGSAGRRAAGEALELAIVEPADGARLLGSIGLQKIDRPGERAEIGYFTVASARRRGVASRAVRLLTTWALAELALTRINIAVHVDNVPSQRVALAAGYNREHVVHDREIGRHGPADAVIFSLTR